MVYETVYEISEHPFPIFSVAALGMCLIAGLILRQRVSAYHQDKKGSVRNRIMIFLALVLLVFCLSIFCFSILTGGSDQSRFAKQYYNGKYETVEGEIENYSEVKRGMVDFSVKTEDFTLQCFFNNPTPKSGKIKVYFVRDSNVNEIVRIDAIK